MLFGRALTGFGAALGICVVPPALGLIAPEKIRGSVGESSAASFSPPISSQLTFSRSLRRLQVSSINSPSSLESSWLNSQDSTSRNLQPGATSRSSPPSSASFNSSSPLSYPPPTLLASLSPRHRNSQVEPSRRKVFSQKKERRTTRRAREERLPRKSWSGSLQEERSRWVFGRC